MGKHALSSRRTTKRQSTDHGKDISFAITQLHGIGLHGGVAERRKMDSDVPDSIQVSARSATISEIFMGGIELDS